METASNTLLERLRQAVGEVHVITQADEQARFLTDWRGLWTGKALAVVLPGSAQEVAAVVSACAACGAPVVPQGGNTGQVAGATADQRGNAVVLVTTRMQRVRSIDVDNATITLDAGCVLAHAQDAARAAGMLFPLSLGAEGSCTIGGNLATNAGGTQVLRYGNARELALGLEVVLADGQIWNGLHGLRKNNTGYDIKDLMIGSEGTLGIITAATMRLFPLPRAQCTAMAAVGSIHQVGRFLKLCRDAFDASLTGFELISGPCLRLVASAYPQLARPFPQSDQPWYVLLELSDSEGEDHARERFDAALGDALERELIVDAAIAQSVAQSRAMWHLRESITLALAQDGKCVKHDISLPVSALPDFVEQTDAMLQQHFPGVRNFTFGHLGDGNLHYNVARPADGTDAQLHAWAAQLSARVHDGVHAARGSISAEQGIGRARTQDLLKYKSPVELRVMQSIKQALDPQGILNPGVLLHGG
ncbi:FAD-binding oxidoreductase [Diaphorobacter ruginosibacter]|uniref:FAD-binding oxidoreductase n=1 Tax=Diaphorobacter ruginosibacter TaxID=1715720 RepID=UPI003342CDC7